MNQDHIEISTPIAAVTMPSADLINYRFDQNDKKTDALSKKLDRLTTSFASVEEVHIINARLNSWVKYGWSIFITLLLIIGGLIAAWIEKGNR